MVFTCIPLGSMPGFNPKYICNFCCDPFTRKNKLEDHVWGFCEVLNEGKWTANPPPVVPVIPFVQLVPFTKGTGLLPIEKLIVMTKFKVNMVEFLIKVTHLNPDTPQYHTILHAKPRGLASTDIDAADVQVFRGGKWKTNRTVAVINQLIDVKLAELEMILI